MTTETIATPRRVGSREQARSLFSALPVDLSESEIHIDCSLVEASAPSFVDEMVKILLVEREAAQVRLLSAPQRTREYAERSARNRGVDARFVAVD
jgi:hypothetical protein